MSNRARWGTRLGFLLAAIGSAIGLGNIWRFPYIAYDNGGGAFFLPYIVALLTAGIPILILEYTMGHKTQGSTPQAYFKLGGKKAEWVGWWQTLVTFVVSTFYPVIIAWALMYALFSISRSWGTDTEIFFLQNYLHITEPGTLGTLNLNVFIPLVLVWGVSLYFVYRGVSKGIEIACRIFIPLLVVMFLALVIRALTLEGALIGLDAFFSPDWSRIRDAQIWLAAYGQIFFSLSIAMAIMMTYASYLPKKSDLTNNAFIAGFSNSSFELLAGIGVFAALGFMANYQGVEVSEAVSSGVGLAFIVFPTIINEIPKFSSVFGVLFFLSLVVGGLTSLISILEAFIAAIMDKFKLSRRRAVTYFGGTAMLLSFLYATGGGLFILDVVDHFNNAFGIALSGLAEVVVIAWGLRKLKTLQHHANEISDIQLKVWWWLSLAVITPLLLGVMAFENFYINLRVPYDDYPTAFLAYGWTVVVVTLVGGILLSTLKWRKELT